MSNELVDLMREFGVEVRMLGTEDAPNPNSVALADMLTEIHRLRAEPAARQPAPVVGDGPSDEQLVTIYQEAAMRAEPSAHGLVVDQFDQIEAGVRAVRDALAAREVQVPDWVDAVVIELHPKHDDAAEWDEIVPSITLTGDTIEEALSGLPDAVEAFDHAKGSAE